VRVRVRVCVCVCMRVVLPVITAAVPGMTLIKYKRNR